MLTDRSLPDSKCIRIQRTLYHRATRSELQSELTGSCVDGRGSMRVDSESEFHLQPLGQSVLDKYLRSECTYVHAGGDFRIQLPTELLTSLVPMELT